MALIEQVKNRLQKELAPIHAKLENMLITFNQLETTVEFVSEESDNLLDQVKKTIETVQHQKADLKNANSAINIIKKYNEDVEEQTEKATDEIEELSQYLRYLESR